ncbi:MAG: hypothetical protein HYU87_05495 [Chloroflexi bacterium]|nr:hypothetical protein [Chloroflexota bacterium]
MAEAAGSRKPYEADDPAELVGVRLPAAPDARAWEEMATVFIEEFALMGWGRARVLRLFADPRFAGPHGALRALGAERVRALVEAVFPGAGS